MGSMRPACVKNSFSLVASNSWESKPQSFLPHQCSQATVPACLHFTLSILILFFKAQLSPSPSEFCWPLAAVFQWKALLCPALVSKQQHWQAAEGRLWRRNPNKLQERGAPLGQRSFGLLKLWNCELLPPSKQPAKSDILYFWRVS